MARGPGGAGVTRGTAPQALTSAPSLTCRHRIPTVRSTRMDTGSTSPGLGAAHGGRRCSFPAHDHPAPSGVARSGGLLPHRADRQHRGARVAAGVLAPRAAAATPGDAADASRQAQAAARPAHPPRRAPARGRRSSSRRSARPRAAAAAQAAAARAELGPVRAGGCAPSRRAATPAGPSHGWPAFLTSDSADDLVQQMMTLDMIAHHTNGVVGEVAAAPAGRRSRAGRRRRAAATARGRAATSSRRSRRRCRRRSPLPGRPSPA